MAQERKGFASKVGLVLATAGLAVGLGNIWRFPVEVGRNGGATYIFIYLICILLLGLPLMVAEFVVGRGTHANGVRSYKMLTRSRFWGQIGKVGVFTGWFVMCYYVVVAGWALDYLVEALFNRFNGLSQSGDPDIYARHFREFVSNPWMPLVCMVALVLVSHYVITRGVRRGIERFAKLLMPLLFIILAVLAVFALFTRGAPEGLNFLFGLDFSNLSSGSVFSAMGQAFFTLCIGGGCLCTFASYFSEETNLVNTAAKVIALDALVAMLSGIIIFPVVFTVGIDPGEGASLVFIALPNVFQQAFGQWPVVCYIVSLLFYFLLVIATLTTIISIHEVPTVYLSEEFGLSRQKGAAVTSAVCIVMGTFCSLSMGLLGDVRLLGRNLFDFFDYTASQILLPGSGLLIAFFVGWVMTKDAVMTQLTNHGLFPAGRYGWIRELLRYVVPVVMILLFLGGLGVIDMF